MYIMHTGCKMVYVANCIVKPKQCITDCIETYCKNVHDFTISKECSIRNICKLFYDKFAFGPWCVYIKIKLIQGRYIVCVYAFIYSLYGFEQHNKETHGENK